MFVEKLKKLDIQYFVQNKLKFEELLNVEFKEDRILVSAVLKRNLYPKTIKNFVLKDFDFKMLIPYNVKNFIKDNKNYKELWIEFLSTNYGQSYLDELNKHKKQNEIVK